MDIVVVLNDEGARVTGDARMWNGMTGEERLFIGMTVTAVKRAIARIMVHRMMKVVGRTGEQVKCPLCGSALKQKVIELMGEKFTDFYCPRCNKTFELVDSEYLEKIEANFRGGRSK